MSKLHINHRTSSWLYLHCRKTTLSRNTERTHSRVRKRSECTTERPSDRLISHGPRSETLGNDLIHSRTFYTKHRSDVMKVGVSACKQVVGWFWMCYRHALKGFSPPTPNLPVLEIWSLVNHGDGARSLTWQLQQCVWICLVFMGGARGWSYTVNCFSITLLNFLYPYWASFITLYTINFNLKRLIKAFTQETWCLYLHSTVEFKQLHKTFPETHFILVTLKKATPKQIDKLTQLRRAIRLGQK